MTCGELSSAFSLSLVSSCSCYEIVLASKVGPTVVVVSTVLSNLFGGLDNVGFVDLEELLTDGFSKFPWVCELGNRSRLTLLECKESHIL